MRRFHLIEIEDQPWCPRSWRDGATDFLQFMADVARPYNVIVPRLKHALEKAGTWRILDMCSGGAGPWVKLREVFEAAGAPVQITLSDKFPNIQAFARTAERSGGQIAYLGEPVDVLAVPESLAGFRTMFAAFHHFPPDLARKILRDAVAKRQGIAIFEATRRGPGAMLSICFAPLVVLMATPWIRPFRWERLFWTYLIPAVPLLVLFDGLVSCLRTYTPDELRALSCDLAEDYTWDIGEEWTKGIPIPITYLIGYPPPQ